MALYDNRKPGLSNNVAKQEGYPTSGEMSANAGTLPAQRQQTPYEQNRTQTNMPQATARPPAVGGGTLNGGAVQGAQYKTQAQNMNPGVASFVSIPQGLNAKPGGGFTPPQPAVPGGTKFEMKQQPQYFAGPQGQQQQQQQQQAQQSSPAQPTAPQPQRPVQDPRSMMPTAAMGPNATIAPSLPEQTNIAPTPAPAPAPTTGTTTSTGVPAPTVDPSKYDYLAEMQKMGQMYDIGGQYDLNQRALAAEKQRQQNMQAWAQNQLMGRGGTATQAQQNYLNTMAALESDTARAQLAQSAHQTELVNRLAFNKQVADEKARLVEMANTLGFSLSDEDFNQIAYENVNAYQGGKPVTPGESVERMKTHAGQPEQKAKEQDANLKHLNIVMNEGNPRDDYDDVYQTVLKMSDEDLKNLGKQKLNEIVMYLFAGGANQRAKNIARRAQEIGVG